MPANFIITINQGAIGIIENVIIYVHIHRHLKKLPKQKLIPYEFLYSCTPEPYINVSSPHVN